MAASTIMPKIFISYRRADSDFPSQWIQEEFVERFGRESVVFDVDSIPLGVDYRRRLEAQVAGCDVLLAVIGRQWLSMLQERLDDPRDFVRIEIATALKRDIPVVPVLIGGAPIPEPDKLPEELRDLAYRNAAEVRAGRDLKNHLRSLANGVTRALGLAVGQAESASTKVPEKERAERTRSPDAASRPQRASRKKQTKAGKKARTPARAVSPPKATSPAARAPEGTWIDAGTGLMWTAKSNGEAVGWNEAGEYAQGLRLGGYRDWRLPTMEELNGLTDPENGWLDSVAPHGVWSRVEDPPDSAWGFVGSTQLSFPVGVTLRAVCVRVPDA